MEAELLASLILFLVVFVTPVIVFIAIAAWAVSKLWGDYNERQNYYRTGGTGRRRKGK